VANPLTFVRPFRPHTIRRVLLVQSAPIDLTLQVAARLHTVFPRCDIDAVVREDERDAAVDGAFTRMFVVRWEDRRQVVRRLRERHYDAVAVILSSRGSDYLRILPYLLRTRSIVVFNDHLDSFPLHVRRLATLAMHVSGRASVGALVTWGVRRVVLGSLAMLVLSTSMLRIHGRAAWRRART
jgi:hypothetical protein